MTSAKTQRMKILCCCLCKDEAYTDLILFLGLENLINTSFCGFPHGLFILKGIENLLTTGGNVFCIKIPEQFISRVGLVKICSNFLYEFPTS
jgi:hypothetical protein